MREIKFRAWIPTPHNKMVYPNELHFYQMMDGSYNYWVKGMGDFKFEMKHNPILMQFTGLHDKNGKEIYEGDIVVWEREEKGTIEWHQGAWWILHKKMYSFLNTCMQYVEVIGNIYGNPELINAEGN